MDHPAAFRWHASSKKNTYFTTFSKGNGSAIENSLDSGRIYFRKRPSAMYKDNAVGNVVAETGRNLVFGTMARLRDLSMPLTGEVRRSPERLQGHRRQPIVRSGKFVRGACSRRALDCACAFSHRARYKTTQCWKRGSGDGQRPSLNDYGTTERSFNTVERRGSTLT